MKINANPDLPILLSGGNDVSYLVRVLFFPDETRVYKFRDFRLNRFHNLWAKSSLLLLDKLCVRIDIEVMHSHLRIKSRHVFVIPSEDISVLLNKRY